MPRTGWWRPVYLAVATTVLTLVGAAAADAQFSYDRLHTFTGNLAPSAGPVTSAADGALYGVSSRGGAFDAGAIFRFASNSITILHSFTDADGAYPSALMQASDGNLYGTTTRGGSFDHGTIFRISTAGAFAVLHDFEASSEFFWYPPLIEASDGHLYGARVSLQSALEGYSSGGIFRVALDGTFNVVLDGTPVLAAPVQDSDGDLYFPTFYGVRRMTLTGQLTILNTVQSSRLMQASDGFLYGITNASIQPGLAIFRMAPDGQTTVIYQYANGGFLRDILTTNGALVEGVDGSLYGTAPFGGSTNPNAPGGGPGTVFRVTRSGGFMLIHTFPGEAFYGGPDGTRPGALTRANDGRLYGPAFDGGPGDRGTLFRVDVDNTFSVVYGFVTGPDGTGVTSLAESIDGTVFGTTSAGGNNGLGTFFRMDTNGAVTILHSFNGADGQSPGGLVRGSDGAFYGLTPSSGPFNAGEIFRVTVDGVVTIIQRFDSALEYGGRLRGLTPTPDGFLYGVVDDTAFKMTLDGAVTMLHHFAGGANDAADISGPLVLAADGNFYGTSNLGGNLSGFGTLFRMTPDGQVTVLHSFFAFDGDYSRLWVNPLTLGSDGNIYGSVAAGTKGPDFSQIFRVNLSGTYTVLHHFNVWGADLPVGRLFQAVDGAFYGRTIDTVFRITPDGLFSVVQEFSSGSPAVKNPVYDVLLSTSDGRLYGVSTEGGIQPGGVTLAPDTLLRFRSPSLDAPFQLTIAVAGNGVVTSTSGITCGTGGACTQTLPQGMVVALNPAASNGWTFVGWSGDRDCVDGTVTISRAVRCQANFYNAGARTPHYRLFWRHRTRGDLVAWNMNATTLVSSGAIQPAQVSDPNWHIVGTADFNHDGEQDLLWLHQTTRQLVVWFMNGTTLVGSDTLYLFVDGYQPALAEPGWSLRAVHDLDGDGSADLIWQNDVDARLQYWFMDGVRVTWDLLGFPHPSDRAWQIIGAADFDRNGNADLLWRNGRTGDLTIWSMQNGLVITALVPTISRMADSNWHVRAILDVNGDDRPDIVWQHVVDGRLMVWLMDGATVLSQQPLTPSRASDTDWEIVGSAELAPPDRTEAAAPIIAAAGGDTPVSNPMPYTLFWQRASDGGLVAWNMSGPTLAAASVLTVPQDRNWHVVAVGDLDNDQSSDLIWQHERTGQVVAWLMDGSQFNRAVLIGTVSDSSWKVRTLADLNGDGHLDIVWQHEREGWIAVWYLNGTTFERAELLTPNRAGDLSWRIVGALDFNGDGQIDLVWQHQQTGQIVLWLMSGPVLQTVTTLSPQVPDPSWRIGAIVDIDGRGPDLIFQNVATGALAAWSIEGSDVTAGHQMTPEAAPDRTWRLAGGR